MIIVVILGGIFAGIATGLVGLSAAAVIVPLLTTIVGIDGYTAVGIALASDVVASFLSAYTYGKNKNIDIKNGVYMMISVVVFTLLASYLSSLINTDHVGSLMNVVTIFLGIRFYFRKSNNTEEDGEPKKEVLKSVLLGALVGIVCGYIGAGGGIMLLVVLTRALGYDTKKAVGTSVFIMGFTALTGAVTHIAMKGTDVTYLIVSIVTATLGAWAASKYANKLPIEKTNKVIGVFLILFGITLTVIKIVT